MKGPGSGYPAGVQFSGDPFAPEPGEVLLSQGFAPEDSGAPTSYGVPSLERRGLQDGSQIGYRQNNYFSRDLPTSTTPLNTYAVLAAAFGVLVPPAGVVLGHLALPQIKRTGQRGWLAAMWGLVTGYLLCAVVVGLLIWLLAIGDRGSNDTGLTAPSAQDAVPPPSVVTSVAPAPMRPHIKLELSQAAVGTCVEIEKRDEAVGDENTDDALDLYEVPCQHRVGVYAVVARVPTGSECNSTYVAAPPDRSFALCLNRY
jgi:hypothetical protein